MEELIRTRMNREGRASSNKKRVMVVVDHASHSKHAVTWALTHVANKGDTLVLLHILPLAQGDDRTTSDASRLLLRRLASTCKSCKPEVEVETVTSRGAKLAEVSSQVKLQKVSVLVIGQEKLSMFKKCFCGGGSNWREEFVEQCINQIDCITIGVRRQGKGMGGYLISTRWQKNFWLLA